MFEFTKHLATFLLVALKLIFPERYLELISNKGLSRLRTFTKETRSEDELYYVWCGFCVIYFSLIGLTLIRNIIDYQWQEHLRRERRNFYSRVGTPILRGRILPRDIEVGSVNDDDPPPYSTIRNVSSVETGKEETNPPRYSQLELPLDYTKSSEHSGNGSSDDCRTAMSNTGSSPYNSRYLKCFNWN
ncbi:hypothetical protein DICVIV_12396 [Dictyocaulus viviparus]|uniref:Uncharacterized protein n=1 Tax=Dictyocaulus viviparus TaxID=29172 RepID=A0A0D8XAJ8_DICVI|nr:hypothetical protein DICVIV_12396 [Dictyocaulus viviparus]